MHIFQPEGRDYYRLEEVWTDALRVDFELEGSQDEAAAPAADAPTEE